MLWVSRWRGDQNCGQMRIANVQNGDQGKRGNYIFLKIQRKLNYDLSFFVCFDHRHNLIFESWFRINLIFDIDDPPPPPPPPHTDLSIIEHLWASARFPLFSASPKYFLGLKSQHLSVVVTKLTLEAKMFVYITLVWDKCKHRLVVPRCTSSSTSF